MERQLHIQQELASISEHLARVPFVATYTIPEGYFAQLPLWIDGKKKGQVYSTPQDYFEQLTQKIWMRINAEDEDELPALLGTIGKQNVYATPANYFAERQFTIPKEEAKVLPIAPVAKVRNMWWRYAAAACAIGVVVLVAFQFINNGNKPNDTKQEFISGTTIKFEEVKKLNVEAAIDSLATNEVDAYLCENGLVACNDDTKEEEKLQQELDKLEISDDDLDKYLDETN